MTSWILYGIMGALALIMLWAIAQSKQSSSNSWARPLALICGLAALATAIVHIVIQLNMPEDDGGQAKRILGFEAAAMRVLGEEIGTHYRGSRILIVTAPETEYNRPRHELIVATITEGLAGRGEIGDLVSFGDNAEEYAQDGEFKAGDFDAIIEANPDHNIILSLLDLPDDFQSMQLWHMHEDTRPRLALVDTNVYHLRRAISSDYIAVAIARNPTYKFNPKDTKVPADYRAAFDLRYLLVTPRTIDDVSDKHGNLFRPEEDE